MRIEKGVPIPEGRSKWNLSAFEVGDSILLADAKEARAARNAASAYTRRFPGIKFRVRATEGGTRIWRTE